MTMAFLTLSMAEIFHSFNMRSRRESIFRMKSHNKYLTGAMILSFILSTLVIYVPFLKDAFDFAAYHYSLPCNINSHTVGKNSVLTASRCTSHNIILALFHTKSEEAEFLENELCYIGLAGMIDPVRPEVVDAIDQCRHLCP